MRRPLAVAATAAACLLGLPAVASAGIWTPYASGTTQDITAVDYRAPDQLYYATGNGEIRKNGALMAGAPGPGTVFNAIEFNPAGTVGLAAANSGKLYRWNGATWSLVDLTNTTFDHTCPGSGGPFPAATPAGNLLSVSWADDATAYVASRDRAVVLKTTNAGANWADASRKADGACFADPGSGDWIGDVQALPGGNVLMITSSFGARRFSSNGLASTAIAYNNTAVNCFGIPMHIAADPASPSRNIAVGDCSGGLSLGFSQDGGATYDLGQDMPNGQQSQLVGLTDIAIAGGSWLISGKGGTILVDSDGRSAYFQNADGALATNDWLAADKFDATNGAVGGRGGALVLSTQANAIPDLIAPAGTISGPITVTAGQPVQYTANVADNAGGSGVNAGSFAWSAPGIPGAAGNPATITFPSPGFYALKVTFTDNAGNAGSATLSVTVKAPPFPVGTPTPGATKTVTVPGGKVTLSGPRTCVPVGKSFSATLSFKRSRKKGAKKIKITRVDFFIDNKRKKIDRKAPFRQRLTVRSYAAGSKHTLKARAYIKVRRGRSPKKSISTSIRVCSA